MSDAQVSIFEAPVVPKGSRAWVPKAALVFAPESPGPTHVEVMLAHSDSEGPVVDQVYELLNKRLGLKGQAKKRPGSGAAAARVRARYRECRQRGMNHEQAVARLLRAVEHCFGKWYGDPKMQGYIRVPTIFRPTKFWEYE